MVYALAPTQAQLGSLRETFFLNQVSAPQLDRPLPLVINYTEQGDFLVDTYQATYHFELGGKGKGKDFRQIRHLDNAFVVADDIEVGAGNRIPLWLFGFLY